MEDFTIEAYVKFVVNGGEDERDFIQSCFWGGDPIDNETEYESIRKQLRNYT